MDKPTPKEIELCRERMNSDEVACALKATTQDDALACKSATRLPGRGEAHARGVHAYANT